MPASNARRRADIRSSRSTTDRVAVRSKRERKELKKRLVAFAAIGRPVAEIAGILNVSESTIRKWLREDSVVQKIAHRIDEHDSTIEKRFTRLLDKAVDRQEKILETGSDKEAAKQIEMIMRMAGKLVDSKSANQQLLEQLAQNGGMMMAGAAVFNGDQAANAMEFLNQTRVKRVSSE